MMDLMDDDDLKKSVINKMMGELDDVTSSSLKRSPAGPVKGVEITIAVAPKHEDAEDGEESPDEEGCDGVDCDNPMHDHADMEKAPEEGDYISQLLKKLG